MKKPISNSLALSITNETIRRMKQRHAVIVLFALIIASSLTSLDSYRYTSEKVNEDMDRALASLKGIIDTQIEAGNL